MKLTFTTKYEAVQALIDLEVTPPKPLWVYPEGSHHVYGGRPWDFCKGTGRYFISDRYLDGNAVAKRAPGIPFSHKYVHYTKEERDAMAAATA